MFKRWENFFCRLTAQTHTFVRALQHCQKIHFYAFMTARHQQSNSWGGGGYISVWDLVGLESGSLPALPAKCILQQTLALCSTDPATLYL